MKTSKMEFKNLHTKDCPIVLMNCWDQESSEILAENNIAVTATSSYALAEALGVRDGENISFRQLLESSKTLSGNFISVDLESGYTRDNTELQEHLNALVSSEVVGINLEDKYPTEKDLIDIKEQSKKLKMISKSEAGQHLFLNARTDTFFSENSLEKNQDRKILEQAIERGKAYEEAGCDGLFVPGLKNKEFIYELTQAIRIPINIMLDIQNEAIRDYLDLGISRISYGPSLYIEWISTQLSKEDYLVSKIAELKALDEKQLIGLTKK